MLLSLVLGAAANAAAAVAEISRFGETVWLNGDGSARLDVEVDLASGTASPLRLPLSLAGAQRLTVSGVDGAEVTPISEGERWFMRVDFPGPLAAPTTLRISGFADQPVAGMTAAPKAFGNRTLTHRLLNGTPIVFGTVTSELVLPAGFVVTSIVDSEPPTEETTTQTPFAVVFRGGRHAVRIAGDRVGLGDALSITVRFKERRVSALTPVALIALGALYLVGCRRLVVGPSAMC